MNSHGKSQRTLYLLKEPAIISAQDMKLDTGTVADSKEEVEHLYIG